MRPSSWLPFCLSFSCFGGGNQPSSTDKAQPTQTTGLGSAQATGTLMSTDPWDLGYFTSRGYALWTEGNVFKVFTDRYSSSSLDPVVHLYVDTKNEAVTIYEDNLDRERRSSRTLKIESIYAALCLRAGIAPDRVQWIAMDADDWNTGIMVRDYRQKNELGRDDFHITPKQEAWEDFSDNRYFQAATQMKPGAKIDRIDVKRQKREVQSPGYSPVEVDYLMFSFQKPLSEDVHDDSMDSIDQDLLEMNNKENFDVIAKAAENAMIVSSTTRLEGEPRGDRAVA